MVGCDDNHPNEQIKCSGLFRCQPLLPSSSLRLSDPLSPWTFQHLCDSSWPMVEQVYVLYSMAQDLIQEGARKCWHSYSVPCHGETAFDFACSCITFVTLAPRMELLRCTTPLLLLEASRTRMSGSGQEPSSGSEQSRSQVTWHLSFHTQSTGRAVHPVCIPPRDTRFLASSLHPTLNSNPAPFYKASKLESISITPGRRPENASDCEIKCNGGFVCGNAS
jgi:hypothetical protein